MRSRFVYALPSVLLALAAVGIGIYGLLLKPQPPAESVEAVHVSGASAQDQTPMYTYSIVTGKVPAGEVVDPGSCCRLTSRLKFPARFRPKRFHWMSQSSVRSEPVSC